MRSTTTTLRRATQSAVVLLICLLGSKVALGATFSDATGDGSFITTFPHLDIASVEITNTATHISFTINLVGDPIATNWGEYQISIDSILGGSTSGNVPPNRPYSMSSGMDYYVRSWNTGGELYRWDNGGSFWAGDFQTYNPPSDLQIPLKTTNSVTLTTTLSSLGLSLGDSFDFDVWSAGGTGTDGAFDVLANPNPAPFGEDFSSPYNAGSNVYTYAVVPEPTTAILGMLAFATLLCRRKQY
jgi:hypothetical protein